MVLDNDGVGPTVNVRDEEVVSGDGKGGSALGCKRSIVLVEGPHTPKNDGLARQVVCKQRVPP